MGLQLLGGGGAVGPRLLGTGEPGGPRQILAAKKSVPYSPVHLIYWQKFRNLPTPGSAPYNPVRLIVMKLL